MTKEVYELVTISIFERFYIQQKKQGEKNIYRQI
jgi:hypothetical protein